MSFKAAQRMSKKMGLWGLCAYCGTNQADSVDHVIPRSGGGVGLKNNTLPCCLSCNASKGKKPLSDWRASSELYNPFLTALKQSEAQVSRSVERGWISEDQAAEYLASISKAVDEIVASAPEKEFFYE